MRELPATLPMRYAPDFFDDEEDVAYDDGDVYFHGSVYGRRLEIHDFIAKAPDLRGARTGIGRKALETVRDHFDQILACQVGEDTSPILEQPAFRFWRRMLVDGLVDGISIGYADCVITRENFHEEAHSIYGSFIPSDGIDDGCDRSPISSASLVV